jgi:hypothetical protein
MRSGVDILEDEPGDGAEVQRKHHYDVRLRMWLNRGDPVRWKKGWGLFGQSQIEDEGTSLFTSIRLDRHHMFAGLFYGVEGMRVGGRRKIRVAPHLAYGEEGVPDVIPANALLTVEVTVLSERAV